MKIRSGWKTRLRRGALVATLAGALIAGVSALAPAPGAAAIDGEGPPGTGCCINPAQPA